MCIFEEDGKDPYKFVGKDSGPKSTRRGEHQSVHLRVEKDFRTRINIWRRMQGPVSVCKEVFKDPHQRIEKESRILTNA